MLQINHLVLLILKILMYLKFIHLLLNKFAFKKNYPIRKINNSKKKK